MIFLLDSIKDVVIKFFNSTLEKNKSVKSTSGQNMTKIFSIFFLKKKFFGCDFQEDKF